MRTILGCLTLYIGFFVCGCQSEATRIERTRITIGGIEYVTIAGGGSTDSETQDTIRTSLEQIGIPCAMWGSIVYDVDVPLAQYREALKRLKHEPRLEKKWIEFP